MALTEVMVVTTAQGPFEEDVFFVLTAVGAGLTVPQAMATDAFLSRLPTLPGFGNSQPSGHYKNSGNRPSRRPIFYRT